jgi:hypothetical protein
MMNDIQGALVAPHYINIDINPSTGLIGKRP